MILYEYPFNERVRTYLRLEHLFARLVDLISRETPLDHHYALISMFDILEVTQRADLKSEVLKNLERQKAHIAAFRGNPIISEATLSAVLERLEDAFNYLSEQRHKLGQELMDNEWLMAVRSRIAIPAGTCSFDLPAYHTWQHQSAVQRRTQLTQWASTLEPMLNAIGLLLQILRDSGRFQKMVALSGVFKQNLPQDRTFSLLRMRVDAKSDLIPEISCNRLLVSVRMMFTTDDGRLHPAQEDAAFELALCA